MLGLRRRTLQTKHHSCGIEITSSDKVSKRNCRAQEEARKTKWPPALQFFSTRFYKFLYRVGRLVEACRFLSDKLCDCKYLIGYCATKGKTEPTSYLRWFKAHLPRAPPVQARERKPDPQSGYCVPPDGWH